MHFSANVSANKWCDDALYALADEDRFITMDTCYVRGWPVVTFYTIQNDVEILRSALDAEGSMTLSSMAKHLKPTSNYILAV